jgi:hypothetical protein
MINSKLSEDSNDEILYNWVFHFNPYTKMWAAIPRELYNDYWNDSNLEGIIRSSKYETLITILYKTKGDLIKIKELIK